MAENLDPGAQGLCEAICSMMALRRVRDPSPAACGSASFRRSRPGRCWSGASHSPALLLRPFRSGKRQTQFALGCSISGADLAQQSRQSFGAPRLKVLCIEGGFRRDVDSASFLHIIALRPKDRNLRSDSREPAFPLESAMQPVRLFPAYTLNETSQSFRSVA